MKSEIIDYTVDNQPFTGYFAWDDEIDELRPGVILVHEWWGHNDFVREQANLLAKQGYRAFAIDMFGSGKLTDDPAIAQQFIDDATQSPVALEARFRTALSLLQQHDSVDPARIAAQGYCFGGGVVLTMARLGVELRGAVSFHGALASDVTAEEGKIQAEIQVYTGGSDLMIPPEQVGTFVEEMQKASVKFTLVSYPGVLHGFTNPLANERAEKFGLPLSYNKDASMDSWQGTLDFYQKIFS